MQRFKSPEQAQRFRAAFGPIRQHFCPRRHLLRAATYRQVFASRLNAWREITAPDAEPPGAAELRPRVLHTPLQLT